MVLTGTNRVRGTHSSRAPLKLPIAAPIALSSWITGGELESRGSTVLRLTISGSSSTPSGLVERLRQHAQVDPQAVRVVVAPAAIVAEGLLVLGRRLRGLAQDELPVGAAARDVSALAVGLGSRPRPPSGTGSRPCSMCAAMRASVVAPRLSALEIIA